MATVMGGTITAVAVIIMDGSRSRPSLWLAASPSLVVIHKSPAHFEEAASWSGLFFISGHACDVADWHLADMASDRLNVRYWKEEPTSDVRCLRSAFDPEADLEVSRKRAGMRGHYGNRPGGLYTARSAGN